MKKLIAILLFSFFACASFASHYRAGEITCRWISGYLYEITVVTYTNTCNTTSDDCTVHVYFGDNTDADAPRINGPVTSNCSPDGDGDIISTCFKKNIYRINHSYPGDGQYMLHIEQPNRKAGILNMPDPLNTPFYIRSYLKINNLLGGHNNSPVLLYPPLDSACIGQCFTHNPLAYDPDGDSLSYSLFNCLGANGAVIPGYTIPSGVSVNALNGDLTWCAPQQNGNIFPQEYNFAMVVHEWRKDSQGKWFEIGYVERDLEVDVLNCNDQVPVVNANDTCVQAGSTAIVNVSASDPDGNQLTLSASGAPFTFTPAAVLTTPVQPQISPASGTLSWNTTCDQVRKYPYQVQFKAKDNAQPVSLSGFKSVFITVVAPAPQNLRDSVTCSSIILSWNSEPCNPVSNALKGYRVYRKNDCNPWNPSYCETGVPSSSGYTLIGTTAQTTFTDNNNGNGLVYGVYYSYRVVAYFADGAESYASQPVCAKLNQEQPVLTNVDVISTGPSDTINIKWLKPLAGAGGLDTALFTGPYKYVLMRAPGIGAPVTRVDSFMSNTFAGLNATSYNDMMLATDTMPYTYRIDFYSNGQKLCINQSGSSVYLTLVPNDNRLQLNWTFSVPWSNYQYDVYRAVPPGAFTYLATTTQTTYIDSGLVNGRTYCYKIKAYGKYSDPSLPAPLINWSEEKCGVPVDRTPPCAPSLSVSSDCDAEASTLTWNNPNLTCADDVVGYTVFYTPTLDGDYQLIAYIPAANITTYIHDSLNSIAGCYEIAAVDSFNNQSVFSNRVCVDNCPVYELPNVFTPNGDGINDLFVPFPYRYVKDIDLKIFNRWGTLVFTTTDPKVLWDGKAMNTKELCSDGVYYYTCKVNEIRLEGIKPRMINGFVQILGGR